MSTRTQLERVHQATRYKSTENESKSAE
jgi:hypothetical protein